MSRYQDKVAVISGGHGAFGQAIARQLSSEGATVVLGDLQYASTALEDGDGYAQMHLDVTSEQSWEAFFAAIIARYGKVDLLVNNAGVICPESYSFEDFPYEAWRRLFEINVHGTFLGTRIGIRYMKEKHDGAIVNLGSVAGYVGSVDAAGYGPSKAAVTNTSKQAALSAAVAGYNIRVNTVHPGFVWTQLVSGKLTRVYGDAELAQKEVAKQVPLGRLAEPRDVAYAVAFLGSDEARAITGADLVIDAGRLLK